MTSKFIYHGITEFAIVNFKPTWLMIKQHKITKLKYFCKTVRADPYSYKGSGTRWWNHLKVHGAEHVETIWCKQFTDIYDLNEFALFFSEYMDIVNSKEWANLVPENGLYGCHGNPKNFSKNSSPKLNSEKGARTLKADPEKLAGRNAKIGVRQKAFIQNNPEAHAVKIEMMTAPIRGATKENSPRIQKQVRNRRIRHVAKMNALMTDIASADLTGLTHKQAATKFNTSGSTFGRILQKLRNGQLTWE